MSNKVEKAVRDPCVAFVKKQPFALHKRMHFGHGAAAGWPDDLIVYGRGHHWWVEFKGEGGEASPLQAHIHSLMRDTGLDVSVIDNFELFQQEFFKRVRDHA